MAVFIKQNGQLKTVGSTNMIGKPEQSKSVTLSMASGDQVVTPDSGKSLSQVTIAKPATLVAENIKKDVVIGGVTGSFEGGGGGSADLDALLQETF